MAKKKKGAARKKNETPLVSSASVSIMFLETTTLSDGGFNVRHGIDGDKIVGMTAAINHGGPQPPAFSFHMIDNSVFGRSPASHYKWNGEFVSGLIYNDRHPQGGSYYGGQRVRIVLFVRQ